MKNKKRDFRKLDENTQAELRRIALLNLDKGQELDFVAELVDVHIQTIRDWIRKRKILESRNFKGQTRGRTEGDKRLLEKDLELDIKSLIENKTPDKLNLGSALWTRRIVQKLIQEKTNKELHLNTVGDYLQRWGFTPQRPGKVAHEQDEKKIQAWIEVEYPKILEQAKKEKAEICFSDETGVSLNTYYGKTYAPCGITPNIKLPSKKNHISMISSMSNMGLLKFMIYKGGLDNDLFIEFLERLTRHSRKKIFLITDNLRVHKSKIVLEWIKNHNEKIAIFPLPPYAPQYNPVELLNNTLKQGIHRNYFPKDYEELLQATTSSILNIKNDKKIIKSFFLTKNTCYAK